MSSSPDTEDAPRAGAESAAPTDSAAPSETPAPTETPAPSEAGRRRTTILTVLGVIVVVVFAVVVAIGVQRTPPPPAEAPVAAPATPPVAGPQAPIPGVVLPSGATAYGVTLGRAGAPVAIDVYMDFQCPFCRRFEERSGATLDQMAASGQARVTYHPLSFFDRFSSTNYSTRAAAAAGCAIDARVYPRFQALLFEQQPPEGGDGLTDERIIALGRQAGAGDRFEGCVRDQRYAPWVSALTSHAVDLGVNSTPDLRVNGESIEHTDEALREAVRSASK
ncbi:MAG TPA: thioredoxin domain-containing protein [Pseudonocardia sp.]|nr:thioredoxin domain-containing protein [Pseudonocardia sp.]